MEQAPRDDGVQKLQAMLEERYDQAIEQYAVESWTEYEAEYGLVPETMQPLTA